MTKPKRKMVKDKEEQEVTPPEGRFHAEEATCREAAGLLGGN